MKGVFMRSQPQVTYNIQAIHDCIVRDTESYLKYKIKTRKLSLYREKQKLLNSRPKIKEMIDVAFIRSLDDKRGQLVGKIGWLPAELVIADPRIRELCRNMFTLAKSSPAKTGKTFVSCPGFGRMSACPPYSFTAEETRAKLNEADIFIALQSKYFIDPPEIRGWQDVLVTKYKKAIEKAAGEGSVTAAFGAGPCQLCHPNPCLGGGECRSPEHRIFALESSGIPVAQLCKDLAILYGDEDWKIRFMKYYGTSRQSHKEWKLTFGLAVKLK
jgi:predicted metal-binding protein